MCVIRDFTVVQTIVKYLANIIVGGEHYLLL